MKNALKFIALAMMLWLAFLAIFGVAFFAVNGINILELYGQAIALSVMVLIGVCAVASQFETKKKDNESIVKMIDVSNLDFARDVAKRLDEHRELVESVEQNTTLLKTHEWHINHLATQDDYLMWLFFLRHGAWPISGNFIGNFRVDMVVRSRPEILGKCLHPSYTH